MKTEETNNKKEFNKDLIKYAPLSRLINIRSYLKIVFKEKIEESASNEEKAKYNDLIKSMDDEILNKILNGESLDDNSNIEM